MIIKSIDRLGRNYDEIIKQGRILTKEKQVKIVMLDMSLLDARKKEKDLTGVFVSDLVLQILSYVAQCERENIRKRQAEGIAAARVKGIHLGRPRIEITKNFNEIYVKYINKEINVYVAIEILNISKTIFFGG